MIYANQQNIKRMVLNLLIALALIIIPLGVVMTAGCSDSSDKANDKANSVAIDKAIAEAIDKRIIALGDTDYLTLNRSDEIKSIRADYIKLTVKQQGYVTQLAMLSAAETKIVELATQSSNQSSNYVFNINDEHANQIRDIIYFEATQSNKAPKYLVYNVTINAINVNYNKETSKYSVLVSLEHNLERREEHENDDQRTFSEEVVYIFNTQDVLDITDIDKISFSCENISLSYYNKDGSRFIGSSYNNDCEYYIYRKGVPTRYHINY